MKLADHFRVVRVYSNGDRAGGAVKLFLSGKQAEAFGIKPGDMFDLRRNEHVELELVPLAPAFKPVPAAPASAGPKRVLFQRRAATLQPEGSP